MELALSRSSWRVGKGCGRAGLSNFATTNNKTTPMAPTLARRKRGASAERLNCHHKSFEYSTCLWEKTPSHREQSKTVVMATIHPG